MEFRYEDIIKEMKAERKKAVLAKDEASDLFDSSTDEKAQNIFIARINLCNKYIFACDESIEVWEKSFITYGGFVSDLKK